MKVYRVEKVSFPTEPKVELVECTQCGNKVNDGYNVYERKRGAKPTFMCDSCFNETNSDCS